MGNEFNLNKINNYINGRDEYLKKHLQEPKNQDFNLSAIFSLFDKNHDGKISKNEFKQVSETEYNQYVEQLKKYNSQNGNNIDNIWSYKQIKDSLDDGFFTSNEAELYFIDNKSKKFDLSGARNLPEEHHLKDMSQMSKDEIYAELQDYGISTENLPERKAKKLLEDARKERILQDIGSDKVDGHIGTYSQGESLYCTVLAQLDTMSDEEVAKMYNKEPKVDSNGRKYWEVQFNDEDEKVIITEDELNDKTIIVEENGVQREVADFPDGDKDVTLLTMAFVKRFGTNITDNGAWGFQTKNKFLTSKDVKFQDNQHLEDFTVEDFKNMPKHSQVCLLNKDELARKDIDVSGNNLDLSWLSPKEQLLLGEVWGTFELSNGTKGLYGKNGIQLSDGTKIVSFHALSVRGFDEKTGELIVGQNEFGNLTELRISSELARFLETASLPKTRGVARTPKPNV